MHKPDGKLHVTRNVINVFPLEVTSRAFVRRHNNNNICCRRKGRVNNNTFINGSMDRKIFTEKKNEKHNIFFLYRTGGRRLFYYVPITVYGVSPSSAGRRLFNDGDRSICVLHILSRENFNFNSHYRHCRPI